MRTPHRPRRCSSPRESGAGCGEIAFFVHSSLTSAAPSCSGLLKGCAEVSLNLLSPGEAVELLLRAGEVDDADEAASAAAAEIAALCGFLPLYLGICGTV